MISEHDKQAILDGAYGITREGKKVKYVGKRDTTDGDSAYPLFFVVFNQKDEISRTLLLSKDFTNFKGLRGDNDVIGLWENSTEPFNLDKALAGEPVLLRNGLKGFVHKALETPDSRNVQYFGVAENCNADGVWYLPTFWNKRLISSIQLHHEQTNYDIMGMWKEPEPEPKTVTLTLPRPVKCINHAFWYINSTRDVRSVFNRVGDKVIGAEELEAGVCFAAKEDAQAWLDALQNSRK